MNVNADQKYYIVLGLPLTASAGFQPKQLQTYAAALILAEEYAGKFPSMTYYVMEVQAKCKRDAPPVPPVVVTVLR